MSIIYTKTLEISLMHHTEITNLLRDHLRSPTVDFVYKYLDEYAWGGIWSELEYQYIYTCSEMHLYQILYMKNEHTNVFDASIVIRQNNKPCAIWPITTSLKNGRPNISSMGHPINAPIFLPMISSKIRKHIESRLVRFLKSISQTHEVELIRGSHGARNCHIKILDHSWYHSLVSIGARPINRHILYSDMQRDLSAIKSSFRKSYRPLVNRTLRDFNSFVMDTENANATTWSEFRRLHKVTAGRETRSADSWAAQFDMINSGKAFLVGLRHKLTNALVGGGFFQTTRDEALYSVGVYDRSYTGSALGHGVQYLAMKKIRESSIKWYVIGQRHFNAGGIEADDKLVTISQFKEGFASHLVVEHCFDINR